MKVVGKCLSVIFFPIAIVGAITKGLTDMARPQNGRYGRKSIAKRKRSRRRF